jgi:hypothetical protein
VCGLSWGRLAMLVGCYECVGCLKYYIKYIFNHSFSGPPSTINSVDGS